MEAQKCQESLSHQRINDDPGTDTPKRGSNAGRVVKRIKEVQQGPLAISLEGVKYPARQIIKLMSFVESSYSARHYDKCFRRFNLTS